MLKSTLGFIILVFIALTVYIYMDKGVLQDTSKFSINDAKNSVKGVSHKDLEIKKSSSLKENLAYSLENIEGSEIGHGLSFESIEEMDVSNEERLRLIGDVMYFNSKHNLKKYNIDKADVENLMKEDLEKGLIP